MGIHCAVYYPDIFNNNIIIIIIRLCKIVISRVTLHCD